MKSWLGLGLRDRSEVKPETRFLIEAFWAAAPSAEVESTPGEARFTGMKSRKWYVKTLGELSITQHFTVINPDSVPPNVSATGSGVCGDGMTQRPKGFPPITLYTLQSMPEPGILVLAPGPVDVYYRRTVVPTDKQTGFGSCFWNSPRQLMQRNLADHAEAQSQVQLDHAAPAELILNILLTLDRQTLGPRHAQTLSDARRLAGLYRATGRPREAAALEQLIDSGPAR